ncbi:MAG TPA: nitroreductase family protein [Acidimicrobiales bacterium]|nr:nitroreductase family protein [Acidimicrobiales bacterium]
MQVHLTTDELLSTTRTVRRRLDLTRPVEREVLEECLALAVQAPTASNRQEWQWVFVTDAATRRALAELYVRPDPSYRSLPTREYAPEDVRARSRAAVAASADFLRQHLAEVPVLLVPCHWGRVDDAPVATQAALWGSLYPAVWSLFLALRTRGLGAAWTSVSLRHERDVAELLGIPYDEYTQGGLFPIAYTVGTEFRPAARRPVAEVVHWDRW